MARYTDGEIGRCTRCNSSVVARSRYMKIGNSEERVHAAACCNESCGRRTAWTLIAADVPAMARAWGLVPDGMQEGVVR